MIDYAFYRNKYRPDKIKTLLIGEAPPPSGKTFFYVPKDLQLSKLVETDTSLPSTIFNHYFGKRPSNVNEYEEMLYILKTEGIFLIDIFDKPIQIRGNKMNEAILIKQIPLLANKIQRELNIDLVENQWIFLLARTSYRKHLNSYFPSASKIRWKDFRLGKSS